MQFQLVNYSVDSIYLWYLWLQVIRFVITVVLLFLQIVMVWESQWALALVGIPTFLFILICEVFLFRHHIPKLVRHKRTFTNKNHHRFMFSQQVYYTLSIFLSFFSIFMLLSCSASLRYIKNSRHNVMNTNQAEQVDYFMLLTISLNGAIWVMSF